MAGVKFCEADVLDGSGDVEDCGNPLGEDGSCPDVDSHLGELRLVSVGAPVSGSRVWRCTDPDCFC